MERLEVRLTRSLLTISGYPPFENLLKAYGIIAFQFDIHPMLLTIEVDMEKKQKIGRAVTYGILGKFIYLNP